LFTGLIEEVGRVERMVESDGKRRLTLATSELVRELKTGNSIAVSGVCLTAVEVGKHSFTSDLAAETWKRTSFSRIRVGALVNLELPLRANDRMGGHIVQGHVDGTGKLVSLARVPDGNDYWLTIEIPPELEKYVVFKGSLAIEGISLTVASVEGPLVGVAIIPHTYEMTNLKSLRPGDPVNLETDLIAKYVEKMMAATSPTATSPTATSPGSVTVDELIRQGF
jgi:riboflavin synthase